jgi:hypothetical protein
MPALPNISNFLRPHLFQCLNCAKRHCIIM